MSGASHVQILTFSSGVNMKKTCQNKRDAFNFVVNTITRRNVYATYF